MPELSPPQQQSTGVLFVDMDGTLIATDLLYESLLLAVKQDPRRGRAVHARGIHELKPRPPRLAWLDGSLFCGQGSAVRAAGALGCRRQRR
jgi:hypothetical protein